MSATQKLLLFAGFSLLTLIVIFLFPSIPQPPAFHHFADTHAIWGVPNFSNVASNIPFMIVGITGLIEVRRGSTPFSIKLTYAILFIGVALTGIGSMYYHWAPDNDRLVWDRLPMTIVFMSLLSVIMGELVSRRLGVALLFPLVGLGIGSVAWWHYTEITGHGDLRLYLWVQFFPMLAIPLLLILYYTPKVKPILRLLVWIVVWYLIAKVLEQMDSPIFRVFGIGGHALKHLAAMVSTMYFVRLFRVHSAPTTMVNVQHRVRSA